MSRIITLAAVFSVLQALPIVAAPTFDAEHAFAVCAGRLSAEREHAWLLAPETSDRVDRQRQAFIDLLDAIAPPHAHDEILTNRILAKAAHGDLLRRAAFGSDPVHAEQAKQRAAHEIRLCRGLLLDS